MRSIKSALKNSTLAEKISGSYFLILVPMLILLVISLLSIWNVNMRYSEMIDAAGTASEFSLDFKKDYDYETYLLIVENKTIEESQLDSMLSEAKRIVEGLEDNRSSKANESRLMSVKKYLRNLETYKLRIEENLKLGNRYEENIEIWENDVQIVTTLLRESILQYIYYEIHDMQESCNNYNSTFTKIIVIMAVLFLCITVGVIIMSVYIPGSITSPLTKLSEVTNEIAAGNLAVRAPELGGADTAVLGESFNLMLDKVNILLEQVKEEQIHLRKAELELLQSQINPHFLYNTLDTIVWLSEGGEQKQVVDMVRSLSDFFRTALNQGKDIVSIKEELLHVSSYLKIQHVRYLDILRYEISIPDELMDYTIPKITIQPLVENALYHGIKNKRGVGTIIISGEVRESDFVISISDDGIGMTPERLEEVRKGITDREAYKDSIYGLYNVNERIRLKFGEEYGLTIDSTYEHGTCVSIRLPYTIREKN